MENAMILCTTHSTEGHLVKILSKLVFRSYSSSINFSCASFDVVMLINELVAQPIVISNMKNFNSHHHENIRIQVFQRANS